MTTSPKASPKPRARMKQDAAAPAALAPAAAESAAAVPSARPAAALTAKGPTKATPRARPTAPAKPAVKAPVTAVATSAPGKAVPKAKSAGATTLDSTAKSKDEKVERDSFSMPASEHKRIKALREALGKHGVLASKSEVLRAGLALLATRDTAELATLIGALPKVAKGKRGKKL